MTKLHSTAGDNDGRCESCDQEVAVQRCVPVLMGLMGGFGAGGGAAWGTMWLCAKCLDEEPHPRCIHGRGPGRCYCGGVAHRV